MFLAVATTQSMVCRTLQGAQHAQPLVVSAAALYVTGISFTPLKGTTSADLLPTWACLTQPLLPSLMPAALWELQVAGHRSHEGCIL